MYYCGSFVDGAFGCGLVNDRNGTLQGAFGFVFRAGCKGHFNLTDCAFHCRPVHAVAQTANFGLTISFLGRFMIGYMFSSSTVKRTDKAALIAKVPRSVNKNIRAQAAGTINSPAPRSPSCPVWRNPVGHHPTERQ